jgi:hypothetical protein
LRRLAAVTPGAFVAALQRLLLAAGRGLPSGDNAGLLYACEQGIRRSGRLLSVRMPAEARVLYDRYEDRAA